MEKKLMKGNEAISEGALRAGCRFYAGYPITPQSEILEYMSVNMDKYGGIFIQGESEIASVCMLWGALAAGMRGMTSSSGPGFSLKQEGIAYIASYNLPAVIVSVMRYGIGGGDITQGQDSYWQAVKGGGNGDYKLIVLSPNSVDECANLTYEAFDLAEKYGNPVLILADGAVGQMVEMCSLPEAKEHDIDKNDWCIRGRALGEPKRKVTNLNWYMGERQWENFVRSKISRIKKELQRYEEYMTKDAEIVLVAYGISSRVAKKAVKDARARGMKLGLVRPISLWPFPQQPFETPPESVRAYVTVEMNILGQMAEDVRTALRFQRPVYTHATAIDVPDSEDIIEYCKLVESGAVEPTEVL